MLAGESQHAMAQIFALYDPSNAVIAQPWSDARSEAALIQLISLLPRRHWNKCTIVHALQIDILAGHLKSGVSGKMTMNGLPFKASEFQKRSCYVLQRDVLLASATVCAFAYAYALFF